jgi:predicted nucleotidyltransferase
MRRARLGAAGAYTSKEVFKRALSEEGIDQEAGLVALVQVGYLEEGEGFHGSPVVTVTIRGGQFAHAKVGSGIKRATARRALVGLLERAEGLRKDPHYLAYPGRLVVFGSYISTDRDRIGDVDVAVEIRDKREPYSDFDSFIEAVRRELQRREELGIPIRGYRARGMPFDWPIDEAWMVLKNRTRALELLAMSGTKKILEEQPHRCIYKAASLEEAWCDPEFSPGGCQVTVKPISRYRCEANRS